MFKGEQVKRKNNWQFHNKPLGKISCSNIRFKYIQVIKVYILWSLVLAPFRDTLIQEDGYLSVIRHSFFLTMSFFLP